MASSDGGDEVHTLQNWYDAFQSADFSSKYVPSDDEQIVPLNVSVQRPKRSVEFPSNRPKSKINLESLNDKLETIIRRISLIEEKVDQASSEITLLTSIINSKLPSVGYPNIHKALSSDETSDSEEIAKNETSEDEVQNDDVPADETQYVEVEIVEDTQIEEDIIEVLPKDVSVDNIQTSNIQVNEIQTSDILTNETPIEEVPIIEIPDDEIVPEENVSIESTVDETSSIESPSSETPTSETPTSEVLSSETPSSEVVSGETTSNETPPLEILVAETQTSDPVSDDITDTVTTYVPYYNKENYACSDSYSILAKDTLNIRVMILGDSDKISLYPFGKAVIDVEYSEWSLCCDIITYEGQILGNMYFNLIRQSGLYVMIPETDYYETEQNRQIDLSEVQRPFYISYEGRLG